MRTKLICIALLIFTSIISYSFLKAANNDNSLLNYTYNELSEPDQVNVEKILIAKLKKDSIFILYNEIFNIQTEALALASFPVTKARKSTNALSAKSLSDLTAYYKDLGIENPDQYAKLDIVKFALLNNLVKKYPVMRGMNLEKRKGIIKSAKSPMNSDDLLRRNKLIQRAIERNSY